MTDQEVTDIEKLVDAALLPIASIRYFQSLYIASTKRDKPTVLEKIAQEKESLRKILDQLKTK